MKLRAPKPITLRAIPASAGLEAWYRNELNKLVDEMHKSALHWIQKTYKENLSNILATDADPTRALTSVVRKLGRRWDRQFSQLSHDTSKRFAAKEYEYNERAFRSSLKDVGFSIKHELAAPMREALPALVEENVGLIKSIPEKYFKSIEKQVIESVERGRDMKALTEHLHARYDITRSHAALIARDQNNKATAQLQKAGQLSVGVNTAMWSHTSASVTPRPEHEDFDGEEYDVEEGMWSDEDGEFVWPGTPINCGCTSHPIIQGFDDDEEA